MRAIASSSHRRPVPGAGACGSVLERPQPRVATVECADSGSEGWNSPASTSRYSAAELAEPRSTTSRPRPAPRRRRRALAIVTARCLTPASSENHRAPWSASSSTSRLSDCQLRRQRVVGERHVGDAPADVGILAVRLARSSSTVAVPAVSTARSSARRAMPVYTEASSSSKTLKMPNTIGSGFGPGSMRRTTRSAGATRAVQLGGAATACRACRACPSRRGSRRDRRPLDRGTNA